MLQRLRNFTLSPYWLGFLNGMTLVNSLTAIIISTLNMLRR